MRFVVAYFKGELNSTGESINVIDIIIESVSVYFIMQRRVRKRGIFSVLGIPNQRNIA